MMGRNKHVEHPDHYAHGEIECIDALRSALGRTEFLGFLRGNVMKYLWRYEMKNGEEDLEKAKWYLDKLISELSRSL